MEETPSKQFDLLIRNVSVLTMDAADRFLPSADIGITGGKIRHLASSCAAERLDAGLVLDGQGCIALPGFVNAHSHIGMSYQRGLADDLRLYDFLDRTFPVQRNASDADIYTFALVACAEMLHSGYTCICDIMENLPSTVKAVKEAGLRAKLSPNIADFLVPGKASDLVDYNLAMFRRYNGAADGRIGIDFNLHAPYSCTEELILGIAQAADASGADLHLHLAENRQEIDDIRKRFQLTPTEYLNKLSVLAPNVLAAHFVQASPSDIALAARCGIRVAHCPASNLKLASGFAPVPEMLESGLCVGLGTDSCVTNNSLNAFETMKLTALIHKATHADATVLPAKQALRLATADGARAVGLGGLTGELAAGKAADMTLLRLSDQAAYLPYFPDIPETLVSHIVYAGSPQAVETVVADGRPLMVNRKILSFDENALIREASGIARSLLERSHILRPVQKRKNPEVI